MRRVTLRRAGEDDKKDSVACLLGVGTASHVNVRSRNVRDLQEHEAKKGCGVASAIDSMAPERVLSRGTRREFRDIVQKEKMMAWRNSEDQKAFLEGATKRDRLIYQRLSEAIYRCYPSIDIAALMRSVDKHHSGYISRRDFVRMLKSLKHGISDDDILSLASRFDTSRNKSADIERFIEIFVEDQRKTPAGVTRNELHQEQEKLDKRRETEDASGGKPITLLREQYLRELVLEAGGSEIQWRLMQKVVNQFEEANWNNKGEQALRALRCGDARQTGCLRRRAFEHAMRLCGILLDAKEYDLLFSLFDRDKSGDVSYDELLQLLDERYVGFSANSAPKPILPDVTNKQGARKDASCAKTFSGRRRFQHEQVQRRLLANQDASVWRAFNQLRKRVAELKCHFPPLDRERFLQFLDHDHNGVVDRKELQNGLRRLAVHVTDDTLDALFRAFDVDDSGALDLDELGFVLEVF